MVGVVEQVMTVTGYEVTLETRVENKITGEREFTRSNIYWCPTCVDDAPVYTSSSIVKEISSRRFDHGTGEAKPCASCGFDTNYIGAPQIIRGRRDAESWHYVDDPEPPHFEVVAQLLDSHVEHAWPQIRRAPGEELTEEHIAPGVKFVHANDAEKTLWVELPRITGKNDAKQERTDEEMDSWGEEVSSLLEACGMVTEVLPDYFEDGEYWYVIAAPK